MRKVKGEKCDLCPRPASRVFVQDRHRHTGGNRDDKVVVCDECAAMLVGLALNDAEVYKFAIHNLEETH